MLAGGAGTRLWPLRVVGTSPSNLFKNDRASRHETVNLRTMNGHCRVCGTRIAPFMSFGRMPIANGFRRPEETSDEYFFELAPAFCTPCGMFQLMEQPQPEKMFHEQYAFYSSTSRYMQRHFESLAHSAISGVLAGRDDPFVVELGSNDGIMLRHFRERGIRHLGVEPSANVADVARQQGISTISAFFERKLADDIAVEHGGADAILAANVMCHIPDLPGVAAGVQRLLKHDGVFIFSATSVRRAFAPFGLELVDVIPQVTHGGSMRYILAPNGSRQISKKVYEQLGKE